VTHVGTIKEAITEKGYHVKKFHGDVLDLGANIGISKLIISKKQLSGKYFCVEPDPNNIRLLKKNFPDSIIIKAAMSNKNGYVFFTKSQTGITGHINKKGKLKVRTDTLNKIISKNKIKPKIVKIDIEGEELSVIKSGQIFLKKYLPLIIVEIHNKEDYKKNFRILKKCGYKKSKEVGNNIWHFN